MFTRANLYEVRITCAEDSPLLQLASTTMNGKPPNDRPRPFRHGQPHCDDGRTGLLLTRLTIVRRNRDFLRAGANSADKPSGQQWDIFGDDFALLLARTSLPAPVIQRWHWDMMFRVCLRGFPFLFPVMNSMIGRWPGPSRYCRLWAESNCCAT